MMKPGEKAIKELVRCALAEDKGSGDITSRLVISSGARLEAKLISRQQGVVAGIEVARLVFRGASPRVKFHPRLRDGALLKPGKIVAVIFGPARPILTAERVALNFLGRLSGIATLTGEFVAKAKPYPARILDTRKTTPLLRQVEKYAVRVGGGYNHRQNLGEQVLIKDNHIKAMAGAAAKRESSLASLVELARRKAPRGVKVEIEVENLRQFRDALRGKPDIIMLDNMNLASVRRAVGLRNSLAGRRPLLEVSGGMTLANVHRFAQTGVDLISVGSLTHSAPSLDFSLELIKSTQ